MKPAPPAPAPITDIFVPAREFRDPDWDAAEREKMWPKVWQMACRESELTAPGAYVNYEILDGALWYRVRPNSRDRDACIFDIWSFGRYEPGGEPVIENEIYHGFEEFAGQCEFLEEDFANLEAVNLGMKSRGFSGAFLNPHQEGTIGNFHRVLRGYIDGE